MVRARNICGILSTVGLSTLMLMNGCKAPVRSNAASSLTDSGGETIGISDNVLPPFACYGDRELLATDGTGFDFNASYLTPANAYWAALAASASYHDDNEVKPVIADLAKDQLVDYHFYDAKELAGYSTEAFYAQLKAGWIFSIRGTSEWADWSTNFDRHKLKTKTTNRKGQLDTMMIHRGFYASSDGLFKKFIENFVKKSPVVTLDAKSDDAFRIVNMTMRGIASEADVYDTHDPSAIFKPTILELRRLGLLKPTADIAVILQAASLWAEEEANLGRARAADIKAGTPSSVAYNTVQTMGLIRKRKAMSRIADSFQFHSFQPLWLVGHSLGGAIAEILGYRLMKVGIPVKGLVTFGGPRPGNDVFKYALEGVLKEDGMEDSFARFHNNSDLIPQVPYLNLENNWDHPGRPWYFDQTGKISVPIRTTSEVKFKNSWRNSKGTAFKEFYEGPIPRTFKTLTQVALDIAFKNSVFNINSDHSMPLHYLKQIESMVFDDHLACTRH